MLRRGDYVGEGIDLPFGLRGAAFTAVEVSTASPLNAQFYAHAKKRGWDHKLASKVCDEPSSPAEWAGCANTCASVHAGKAVDAVSTARHLGGCESLKCNKQQRSNQIFCLLYTRRHPIGTV